MEKGYKEESMDQKKRKKLKDMKEERNDLCITALSLFESSLSPVQFSGVWGQQSSEVAGESKGEI